MPPSPRKRIVTRRGSSIVLRAPDAPPRQGSSVVLRAPDQDPAGPLHEKTWFVWVEGGEPVGPVSLEQIARGMKAGKVPSEASVRRHTDVFWTELLDVPEVIQALKSVTAETEAPPSVPTARLTMKEWLVWVDGSDPIGPVSADQIARGIKAGKVTSDANIQRVDDFFATGVLDEPDVIAALKAL